MNDPSFHEPLRLGIVGLGTVGIGVIHLLQTNGKSIANRAGRPVKIMAISARDKDKGRGFDLSHIRWIDDPLKLAIDPNIDVVIELIGGAESVAYQLVKTSLNAKKAVITANKALIALRGNELSELAEQNNVPLLFEAAVAGGIPIVKTIKEALAADRLQRIGGILNGTCNYILTAMTKKECSFENTLKEAQALGYAEADPSMDIDGCDSAHKLTILASLGFGHTIKFEDVFVEGIRDIDPFDLHYAKELGYTLKLIGVAQRHPDESIELRVHPALLPNQSPLSRIDGIINTVFTEGEFSGQLMLEGAGAGAGPTSAAVCADIIDLARGNTIPVWRTTWKELTPATLVLQSDFYKAYYIRLMVIDKPGVVADITTILKKHDISLRSLLQHDTSLFLEQKKLVPIILITHKTKESSILLALEAIHYLPVVYEKPIMIRIEKD